MNNCRDTERSTNGNFWGFYDNWEAEECAAEKCAESIRKHRNLPPGTSVPVMIVCRCKRCNPFSY